MADYCESHSFQGIGDEPCPYCERDLARAEIEQWQEKDRNWQEHYRAQERDKRELKDEAERLAGEIEHKTKRISELENSLQYLQSSFLIHADYCQAIHRRADLYGGDSELTKGTPCIGKDPTCPCQDGDMCHYEGPDAWPIPEQGHKGNYDIQTPAFRRKAQIDEVEPYQPVSEQDRTPCGHCGGSGFLIDYVRTGPDGDEQRVDTKCNECGGTGLVPAESEKDAD